MSAKEKGLVMKRISKSKSFFVCLDCSAGKKADIALMVDHTPKVIVETKSHEKTLEAYKTQTLGYAQKKGIMWALLTNGNEWQLYKSFIEGVEDRRNKPVFETRLQHIENDFIELEKLIGHDHIADLDVVTKPQVEAIRKAITEEDLLETLHLSILGSRSALSNIQNSTLPSNFISSILAEVVWRGTELDELFPQYAEVEGTFYVSYALIFGSIDSNNSTIWLGKMAESMTSARLLVGQMDQKVSEGLENTIDPRLSIS